MLKMPVPVFVDSVREGKDKSFYADFMFLGGSISVSVDRAAAENLKPLIGKEVVAVFEMRPKTQVLFGDRPVSMFQPVGFVELEHKAAPLSGVNPQR